LNALSLGEVQEERTFWPEVIFERDRKEAAEICHSAEFKHVLVEGTDECCPSKSHLVSHLRFSTGTQHVEGAHVHGPELHDVQ